MNLAPSGMTHRTGTVLGLYALILVIRLVESRRLPDAWGAVFGAGGTPTPPAPNTVPAPAPNPATAAAGQAGRSPGGLGG